VSGSVALLACALAVASAAWGFWHYLGQEAVQVLGAAMIVLLAVDNFCIRRELNRCRKSDFVKKG
jgi:hypothetical protein